MDSWSYGSDGRGLILSDEMVSSTTDAVARTSKVLTNWDLKVPSNCENAMLLSCEEVVGNQSFIGLGEERSGVPRVSSSIIDSSTWDSSLIDLKLGRFVDHRESKSGKWLKEDSVSSSIGSSVAPVKRSRPSNSNGQAPFCQVHGCNMDLSSSKDYHKRHKVCEIHSKTARVIVNGIEQRFCQQCSRFHLLAEFDDGKRSCRKRLAGHNERRRKPQMDSQSGKAGKLLPSCHGSRFLGTSSSAAPSFICADIFPSCAVRAAKYEESNWYQHVKVEDNADTQSLIPIVNGHLLQKQKPFLIPSGMEKQFPFLHGVGTVSGSLCYENGNRYVQDFTGSQLHFNNGPSGTEEFASFNASLTIKPLHGVSGSVGALSLLSKQSQSLSTNLSAIPMAHPLTIQGRYNCYSVGEFPDKNFAVNSQASTSVPLSTFSSPGTDDDNMGAMLASDASNAISFEAQVKRNFLGSGLVDSKDTIPSREPDHTVDLLHSSLQLQSAELQKHSMQVKQESGTLCCLPIT